MLCVSSLPFEHRTYVPFAIVRWSIAIALVLLNKIRSIVHRPLWSLAMSRRGKRHQPRDKGRCFVWVAFGSPGKRSEGIREGVLAFLNGCFSRPVNGPAGAISALNRWFHCSAVIGTCASFVSQWRNCSPCLPVQIECQSCFIRVLANSTFLGANCKERVVLGLV